MKPRITGVESRYYGVRLKWISLLPSPQTAYWQKLTNKTMQSFAKDKQIIVEGYLNQFKNPDDPILITRKELMEFINEFFKEMNCVIDWKTLKLKKKKKVNDK